MAVPSVNIVLDKGTDFSRNFKLKKDGSPINLSGYTFSVKMKKYYSSSTQYNFTAQAIIPQTSGILNIGMASSITATIPTGRYVYDVLITYSGNTTKVIEGNVLVKGTAS